MLFSGVVFVLPNVLGLHPKSKIIQQDYSKQTRFLTTSNDMDIVTGED